MHGLGLKGAIQFMIGPSLVLAVALLFALDLGPTRSAPAQLSTAPFAGVNDGKFLQPTPLPVTPLRRVERSGRKVFTLLADRYYSLDETDEVIQAPNTFVTDFATLPRVARSRYDPAQFAEAATVLDYLDAIGAKVGRPKADSVFNAMMLETGVSERRAAVLDRTVRIGGNGGNGLDTDWQFRDVQGNKVAPLVDRATAGVIDTINFRLDFFAKYLDAVPEPGSQM